MRKTGWLEKEGMSGVQWNRRFVCVQRGSLRYWSEEPGSAANSKRCKGSMQICEDTVVSPTKQARPGRYAFRIDLGMQKFVLSASSEAEVDEWVEAVVRAGGKRSTRWSEPTAYQALEPEHAPPRSGASTPTQQTPPASPSRPLTPTLTLSTSWISDSGGDDAPSVLLGGEHAPTQRFAPDCPEWSTHLRPIAVPVPGSSRISDAALAHGGSGQGAAPSVAREPSI